MSSLPVTTLFADLHQALIRATTTGQGAQLLVIAPTGAGKSTALPLSLLNLPQLASHKILMLEPRRLAARAVADYLAAQLGEPLGQRIGLRMRGEVKVSAQTRLEVVTEGMLTRLLQQDPMLSDVALVLFDECHERSLQADLALTLCLDACSALRPDLSLLLMSATPDTQIWQGLLPDLQQLQCSGRSYPVTRYYQPRNKQQPLLSQCVSLIAQAVREQSVGDILVFLPGSGEIQRVKQMLEEASWCADVTVLPLYGAMSLAAQRQVLQPGRQRRIILATNVAETSITLPDIRTVVDSGLERRLRFDLRAGIGRFTTQSIARSSALQRAGRAGRVAPGVCYHLFSESQEQAMADTRSAAILQSDLSSLVLEVAAWGVTDAQQLAWPDRPPESAWQQARQLLHALGAVDRHGAITAHGRQLQQLGIAPRLAQLLCYWQKQPRALATACVLAALLEERDPLRHRIQGASLDQRLLHWRQGGKVLAQRVQRLWQLSGQTTAMPATDWPAGRVLAPAFVDRIALRRGDSIRYQLAQGVGAQLAEDDPLRQTSWLVVADLSLREQGGDGRILLAAEYRQEWLTDDLAEHIEYHDEVVIEGEQGRLRQRRKNCLGALTLAAQLLPVSAEQRPQLLLQVVREQGLALCHWSPAAQQFRARLSCAHAWQGDEWPAVDDVALLAELEHWLLPFLTPDIDSVAGIKRVDVVAALTFWLGPQRTQQLTQDYPSSFTTPLENRVTIAYQPDAGAEVALPMQELYGLDEAIWLPGQRALRFVLLSPARRPLQVTDDLPRFWRGAYHDIRKEMRGRYPKHLWPEHPESTPATRKTKKQLTQQ